MSWNGVFLRFVVAVFLIGTACCAEAQSAPSAYQGALPLRVGGGLAIYNTEIYSTSQMGPTVWIDWTPGRMPGFLRGLGFEAEGRELLWGQPNGSTWTVATVGGGPIYSWRRSRSIRPYVKGLLNYGMQWNIKNNALPAWYTSDKWMTYAIGGGIDVRVKGAIWVRGDYEYQFWKPNWFNTNDYLNPKGLTLGVLYDFGGRRSR